MKTKILLLVFILLCFSYQNLFATNVPAGNVSGQWTQAGSPYLVLGNITVPQDSLLQIDAGVVVQFQGHYQLMVRGRILALGSSGNPIMFNATTTWWGIRFDGISASQDSSLFIYCNIQDGNANGTGNYEKGGAFFISYFSKIRVEHCTIANNYANYRAGGFYLDHAHPRIYNNVIDNNTAGSYCYGEGIYCYFSSPSIVNNIFTNHGNSIYCDRSSPDIIGNTIRYSGCAGIICIDTSPASIINNSISNNNGGIIVIRSSPNITGNLITHNSGNPYGPGIMAYDHSYPAIINNTIANNSATNRGGGISLAGTTSPTFKNNILWGNYAPSNQGEELTLDGTCSPTFNNCDIRGGSAQFYYYDAPNTFTGTYVNNLDSNPLFINPSINNFSLQTNSPCINAGDTTGLNLTPTDLSGSPRVCNNAIEMGAYEICPVGISEFSQNKSGVIVYPNPFHDRATLALGEYCSSCLLEIYDALGQKASGKIFSGWQTEIIHSEIKSGFYFFSVHDKGKIIVQGKFIAE